MKLTQPQRNLLAELARGMPLELGTQVNARTARALEQRGLAEITHDELWATVAMLPVPNWPAWARRAKWRRSVLRHAAVWLLPSAGGISA